MDSFKQKPFSADDFFGNSRELSLQKFLKRVKKKWWYFQISLPICLLLAFAVTHFSTPKFLVGTRLITPERNVNNTFGADQNNENFAILNTERNILNETEVLRSYGLAERVAKSMGMNVSYFFRQKMKNIEEYGSAPYWVELDPAAHQISNSPIEIEILDAQTYSVSVSEDKFWAYRMQDENYIQSSESFSFQGKCQFGEECETRFFKFKIYLLDWAKKEFANNEAEKPNRFFKINSNKDIASMIRGSVEVELPVEDATVISISMETANPQKGIDILNELSKQYQSQRLEEKNRFITKQIEFIEKQLGMVRDSLGGKRRTLETVQKGSSLNTQNQASQLERQIQELSRALADEQYKYDYLVQIQSMVTGGNATSLPDPASAGINNQVLTAAIIELKDLSSRKMELEISAPLSPELDILKQKISVTESTLKDQVNGLVTSYSAKVSSLRGQIGRARGQLSQTITGDRTSRLIEDQLATDSKMFSLLQQKRAEAIIARESNASDIQVLEPARMLQDNPISPNIPLTLAMAIFFGLMIPLGVMVAQEYFVSKIEDINDLGSYSRVPVITSVPHGSGNDVLRTGSIDKVTLESFRFLKLKLIGLAEDENFQVISVTSYIPSEGKNYCATNLATAMAVAGKKVMMLDADMRKLPVYYSKSIGLSEHLNDQASLEEIIQSTDVDNLYYITSGEIADKPTELLESRNMKDLIMQLKTEFDYIIINTPPVGIVSDLYVLSKYVDISLFVVRHNYTPIEHIAEIDNIREVTGIRETYIIYNDVDKEADKYRRYGQNYGYLGGHAEKITLNQNGMTQKAVDR